MVSWCWFSIVACSIFSLSPVHGPIQHTVIVGRGGDAWRFERRQRPAVLWAFLLSSGALLFSTCEPFNGQCQFCFFCSWSWGNTSVFVIQTHFEIELAYFFANIFWQNCIGIAWWRQLILLLGTHFIHSEKGNPDVQMKGTLYLRKLFSFLVFQSGIAPLFCLSQAFIRGQFNSFLQ